MKTGKKLVPVILSGGVGSRLWPVSREGCPKPFIRLDDDLSFLQKTLLRAAELPEVREVLTVTNEELFFKTKDEYDKLEENGINVITNFILEPFARNTAPAVASACIKLKEIHGDEIILLVLAADHLITDKQAFKQAVDTACKLAIDGKIVTFGIKPNAPETGYGYIESDGYDAISFTEKPTVEKAEKFVKSGNFWWNSGMFCFAVKDMLIELERYSPQLLMQVRACFENSRNVVEDGFFEVHLNPKTFNNVEDVSIDYAVMEKTSNAAVVPCEIGWSDIGSWNSLGNLIKPDENGNRISGHALMVDSDNCTAISDDNKIICVVGVKDMIIVDTQDALLISEKKHDQKVKDVYAKLKQSDHESHKLHRTVHRPWGTYAILEEGNNFKIKRIEVKPGARLSLQKHKHRSEHWVVIYGVAQVVNDDQELVLHVNESTFIPAGHIHRLTNIGEETMVLIEVQTGEYLGEDDIVRLDDIYGRLKE